MKEINDKLDFIKINEDVCERCQEIFSPQTGRKYFQKTTDKKQLSKIYKGRLKFNGKEKKKPNLI